MIKLIFSDLDGTLLNTNKIVTPDTVNFIKELKGVRFMINTGRLPYNVSYLSKYIDLANTVCGNGSCIKIDNEVVCSCQLDKDDAKALIDFGYKIGSTPRVFMESDMYVTEVPKIPTYVVPCMITKTELDQLLNKEGVYKIGFLEDDKDTQNSIFDFIKNNTKGIRAEFSNFHFIECYPSNVSKGMAIDKTCELLNTSKDEVLAIGDNQNDLSMFNRGYHTACPANATDDVKKAVEYISKYDCDHDSMIDIIKHFM